MFAMMLIEENGVSIIKRTTCTSLSQEEVTIHAHASAKIKDR